MAKMSREEILAAAAELHLEEGRELKAQSEELSKKRTSNRQALMNEVAMGHLTDEQIVEVDNLYPTRERATPEQRVQTLREQLAKAEARATADGDESVADEPVAA